MVLRSTQNIKRGVILKKSVQIISKCRVNRKISFISHLNQTDLIGQEMFDAKNIWIKALKYKNKYAIQCIDLTKTKMVKKLKKQLKDYEQSS